MTIVYVLLPFVPDHAEIAETIHLRMIAQEFAHFRGILAGPLHPQFHRFQAAEQHPCRIRVADAAHRITQGAYRVHPLLRAAYAARDEIGMAADIFRQRIDYDIGSVIQWALPQGAEESVVDGDGNGIVGIAEGCVTRIPHRFDIDKGIGGIAGAFEIDHRDLAALILRLLARFRQHRIQFLARGTGGKIDVGDAELAQYLGDETFAGGVKRAGVDDHVAGGAIGQHENADRGHAAGEAQGVLRAIPDGEAVFQNFLVRTVEARIDQPLGTAGPLTGNPLEMPFPCSGAFESEGRGEENRGLQRPFGQGRIVTVAHHQGAGLDLASGDGGNFRLGLAAGSRGFRGIDSICHVGGFLALFPPGRRGEWLWATGGDQGS